MKLATASIALLVLVSAAAPAPAAVPDDAWLEGYVAAVLERELRVTAPSLRARSGVISLSAADLAPADRVRVVATLQALRGVARVEVLEPGAAPAPAPATPPPPTPALAEARPPRGLVDLEEGLMPGGTLFKPLIADPRWPHFAASYQRYRDDPTLRDVAAVSFGETFALYRDRLARGWWEVGIQAGVFAVFDLGAPSKDLVNADYFVALPLTYRYRDFSTLLRVFHQSSHLGDEFLLRTKTARINLSYESVDLKLSREFGDVLRIYGGGGYLFDQEPVDLHPWSFQYGIELTSPWPRNGRWRPIAAVDVQHREENRWAADLSLRAGIQVDSVLAARSFQIMLEYFSGHSPNGQFYKQEIEYLGLGTHFHF